MLAFFLFWKLLTCRKQNKENFVKKIRRLVDSGFVKTCDELVIDLLETVFLNWIANQYLHSQKYVIQQVVLARPIPWYKTWTLQRIRVTIFTNMHVVALLNG